ncbi:MAG: NUDIX hydrolase [Cellulomonadaceae bacterium]
MDEAIQLAVSTVVLALLPHPETGLATPWLPLVRRIREPQEGLWALPGGPLRAEEDLDAAARRALGDTTGLAPRYLEQLYAFGGLDRAPGAQTRVVSIVYWALVRPEEAARAVDGENVEWFVAADLPDLAFDHREIVDYALQRLHAKLGYSQIAHAFLPDEFTLAQLREVYEAVWAKELDPANFRRQVLASDTLEPTGRRLEGTSHRPPSLYRYADGARRRNLLTPKERTTR